MKAYGAIIHPRMRDLFALAEGDGEVETEFLDPELEAASEMLYYVLVMLVRKEAAVIVANAGPSQGGLAWRRLVRWFEPISKVRLATMLLNLIRFIFSGEIRARLELFQHECFGYEQRSGEKLSLNLRIGFY